MLTTIVDHNDTRLQSMESDGGKPYSQLNDSSRQGAGGLQAKDRCQPSLDMVLSHANWLVHQRGTATRTR